MTMQSASVKIGRDEHVWSFDAGRQPVVTVDPGTIIEIETWDCFTGQVQSEEDTLEKLDLARVNSAPGAVGVRGAEPGDTVAGTLLCFFRSPVTSASRSTVIRRRAA